MGNGPTPIANEVDRNMHGPQDEKTLGHRPRSHTERPANTNKATLNGNEDFLSDLIQAQHELITAQHAFLYEPDLVKLAAAQRHFSLVQSSVLDRLGVFG